MIKKSDFNHQIMCVLVILRKLECMRVHGWMCYFNELSWLIDCSTYDEKNDETSRNEASSLGGPKQEAIHRDEALNLREPRLLIRS